MEHLNIVVNKNNIVQNIETFIIENNQDIEKALKSFLNKINTFRFRRLTKEEEKEVE